MERVFKAYDPGFRASPIFPFPTCLRSPDVLSNLPCDFQSTFNCLCTRVCKENLGRRKGSSGAMRRVSQTSFRLSEGDEKLGKLSGPLVMIDIARVYDFGSLFIQDLLDRNQKSAK